MRRLLFQKLQLLSLKEKKAKEVVFHPKVTIIKGVNDTGKSCLIKTLYRTLGAEVPNIQDKWEQANVISILSFSIDGVEYKIIRDGKLFCLYKDGTIIGRYSSITKELSPALATLFNFKLQLKSRGTETQATPAFLYLPFYFDQDQSWNIQWNGFKNLAQFTRWRDDLINFHTGIKPTEFFEAKVKKNILVDEKASFIARKDFMNTTRLDIEQRLNLADFNIDIKAYQKEINVLLSKCQSLKQDEEKLKNKMLELHNSKCSLTEQKYIIEYSLAALEKDYSFAVEKLPDQVSCPTCGNVYENSFNERFNIAQDEYRCNELLVEVNSKLDLVNQEIESLDHKVTEIKLEHSDINKLLEVKRGEVKLDDIIKSAGRKEVYNVLQEELSILLTKIDDIEKLINDQEKIMKTFDDKERTATIKSKYVALMKHFLRQLDVINLSENKYKKINCNINNLSGNKTPRALLAYYYSILHTINAFSTSTYCPIVLDSARQQDPDLDHWEKMLNFIKNEQPENSQLIMGLVNDLDMDFGGEVIELKEKYNLLQENEFEGVYNDIIPLMEQSRR